MPARLVARKVVAPWLRIPTSEHGLGQPMCLALRTSVAARATTCGTRTGAASASPGATSKVASQNFFALGPSLIDAPFDDLVVVLFETDWMVRYAYLVPLEAAVDHHKQLGVQGCRLMIRGDDSWRSDPRVRRLD